MQTYIVGGAVRDMIMGIKPKDTDYVIVGATAQDVEKLKAEGYKQVGADFPVFLNPWTSEEYALARIERKTGSGYLGFACETENVTLEQDLLRRDLTMNAIAYDPRTKKVIDPYNGAADIQKKIIRHVSEAFAEDPVRVLRVARFAARYGFTVHESTNIMMQNMVKKGELNHLQRERVMQEMTKCINENGDIITFVKVLARCGAWQVLFPEIPAPNKEHQAIIHAAVTACASAQRLNYFTAALMVNLSVDEMEKLQARMVFPSVAYRFAKVAVLSYKVLGQFNKLKAVEVVEFFEKHSIINKGGEGFLMELNNFAFANGVMTRAMDDYVLKLFDLFYEVEAEPLIEAAKEAGTPLIGRAIRDKLTEVRVAKITEVLK